MCGLSLLLEGVGKLCYEEVVYSLGNSARSSIETELNYSLSRRGPDSIGTLIRTIGDVRVTLQSSLLQLRGLTKVHDPLHYVQNKDILFGFNGEIYSGLPSFAAGDTDTVKLFECLAAAEDFDAQLEILSHLRGPWSLIYCDFRRDYILVGKDSMGRRSLLVHMPDSSDPRFMVTSTAPTMSAKNVQIPWNELGCGIHRLLFSRDSKSYDTVIKVDWHPWKGNIYKYLRAHRNLARVWAAKHDRARRLCSFINCLDRSVRIRVHAREYMGQISLNTVHRNNSTVLILFSGGLDSTVLAAVAHRNVPLCETIDLCNVCFHSGSSPDRLAACEAFLELQKLTPGRSWRFIEVNVSEKDLLDHVQHVASLIHPQHTKMDYNIGLALWFATRARGLATFYSPLVVMKRQNYCSDAKVVLLGQGADELLGGYNRHREAFRNGGGNSLVNEINKDLGRLWIRNLGRDDRVVSDLGREARYPFLDEELVYEVRKFQQDFTGNLLMKNDKLLLRISAVHLGLTFTSNRAKRAIQFGSGIHRLEDKFSGVL